MEMAQHTEWEYDWRQCRHRKWLDLNNLIHEHIEGHGPHDLNLINLSLGRLVLALLAKFKESRTVLRRDFPQTKSLYSLVAGVMGSLFFYPSCTLGIILSDLLEFLYFMYKTCFEIFSTGSYSWPFLLP